MPNDDDDDDDDLDLFFTPQYFKNNIQKLLIDDIVVLKVRCDSCNRSRRKSFHGGIVITQSISPAISQYVENVAATSNSPANSNEAQMILKKKRKIEQENMSTLFKQNRILEEQRTTWVSLSYDHHCTNLIFGHHKPILQKFNWLCLIFVCLTECFNVANGMLGKSQFCEVETGQTNIIVDIEESRDDYIGQETTPRDLPIYGDPETEILLELIFPKGNPSFMLNGKQLKLLKPLDRDEENLSHIVFQVSCTIRSSKKKRNIPIIVRVSDINDNAPQFVNTPYEVTVPESTPIGTTIFRKIQALDKDAGVNGLVEYFIMPSTGNITQNDKLNVADGYGTFEISFPHQGQVTLAKNLDYERIQQYQLIVVASDRARNVTARLSSTTTLLVNIADSDDLDPSFIYRGCVLLDGACINPEYTASVPAGSLQGVLSVLPERIQAVDLDTLSSSIRYSFLSGMPGNYENYFEIDEQTGILKQIKSVDTSTARHYDIVVKAEEVSPAKRFTTAKLTIQVKPVDANPPVTTVSENEGYVDENSPIGTQILGASGMPILFKTTDADLSNDDPKPKYIYELTTPSFAVNKENILVVNEENLDRDPPNQGKFTFQVVAREPETNAAGAPLSITVYLRDVNDNAPKLPMIPPITITAGDGRRLVTQVKATDNDEAENAVISYSIYHVSNNGGKKFSINENTGEIESNAKLLAGEQYSLTVQATDIGGLYSQAIVDIVVIPGPNTKPPRFAKNVYDVQVSEGAEINSTVIVIKADDPENDPVMYAITSGNDLRQFSVGQDTGVITVIRKLDRESLTRYQLTIRAEDNGGLSSTATVNIKVADINDKNPEFDEASLPYLFHVDEGNANTVVGVVHATDEDEGINAKITYSIPAEIPFTINPDSGEIRTTKKLDYETQNEYKFVVTAKDGAPDARLGTASVTVSVNDLPDELPKFTDSRIDVHIPENVPDYVVTTVKAVDPDTVKQVTYVIRKGSTELFKVDAKSGSVKTTQGLDYEKDKQHELIVGTIENDGEGAGDFVRIIVNVDDRNDIPPVFVSVPEPVTISDDQPIGAVIAKMPAIDGDGSSPGNVVRYEMVGRGKALKYFQVDADTGSIRVRDELRKEDDTEYQIDIRAYDMGEPQLSSVATLPVFVRHMIIDPNDDERMQAKMDGGVIMNPETLGLAFSDDSYTTGVPETTGLNATIKLIQIINSKKTTRNGAGFKCEFIGGNENNIFSLTAEDHACGVILNKNLDYETQTHHDLEIKLISGKYFVNPQKSVTKVKVIVQDENDNAPEFVFARQHKHKNTFYAIVNPDVDIDTSILQVKAIDKDSGKFGMIKYKIYDEDENSIENEILPTKYFAMTEDTGILRTQRSLHDIKSFPMKFNVEARDNNGIEEGSHVARARIVVNLITDLNRMSLVFSDSSPNEIRSHHIELEELIEEKTNGLIAGIEKFSNRKFLNENATVVENPSATDVWFYAIHPDNEMILTRNDTEVSSNLLEPAAQSEINFAASGIARATAQGIFSPLEPKHHVQKVTTAILISDDVFPYALIGLSIVILVLGTIGIIYICISWAKYKNFKQRMRQYSAPSSPTRYDPVILGSQNGDTITNLKEYETQVLNMAVPPDGDDEMQLDFGTKNHAFSLDNVSYITHKDNNGQSSPANSEATTATTATLRRNNNNMNINNNLSNNRQNTFNRTLEMNRNNANPLASGNGANLPGTLTLGRIKQNSNNIYQNGGYKMDTLSRNNMQNLQNNKDNAYSTLTRGGNNNGRNNNSTFHQNELMTNTLDRNNYNNRYKDAPITNPLFQRINDANHISATNENVSFGKRDYAQLGFSYLNDLDRSEVETTTEL
ncbi:cadherin-99C [Condylostylus longicornis]|uniref:cadherin-99C n=1 Tax=Condylostylus longicornis TaxID=2530218 RepID=UPI00244DDC6A|nr:cadherin-99C [Condylostylus longicornis]